MLKGSEGPHMDKMEQMGLKDRKDPMGPQGPPGNMEQTELDGSNALIATSNEPAGLTALMAQGQKNWAGVDDNGNGSRTSRNNGADSSIHL